MSLSSLGVCIVSYHRHRRRRRRSFPYRAAVGRHRCQHRHRHRPRDRGCGHGVCHARVIAKLYTEQRQISEISNFFYVSVGLLSGVCCSAPAVRAPYGLPRIEERLLAGLVVN